MAHSLSPYSLVARRAATVPLHPAVAARSARARHAVAAAATTVAVGATLLLTPRAAQADPLYEACLDAVHGAALKCIDSADNILGEFACMWVGGLGYIACAFIEAIRQLLPGGLNIT